MCECNKDDYARGYNEGYERARRDMLEILEERISMHDADTINGNSVALGRYREDIHLKSMISKEE